MDLSELVRFVVEGDADNAESFTLEALAQGTPAEDIVNTGLIPGMDIVGEKFTSREYFMPEMLVSARAMKRAMEHLRPLLQRPLLLSFHAHLVLSSRHGQGKTRTRKPGRHAPPGTCRGPQLSPSRPTRRSPSHKPAARPTSRPHAPLARSRHGASTARSRTVRLRLGIQIFNMNIEMVTTDFFPILIFNIYIV